MANRSTSSIVLVLALSIAGRASANGPEDQLGLGARVAAMGGAGTAMGGDATAVYYNVAGLAFCPESQVYVDARHTGYGLRVERTGPDAPTSSQRPVPDQTRVTVGACLRLPRHFALGMLFGAGMQDPASLSQTTPSTSPQFVGYGSALSQLTIAMGAAYRPIPELAIGFGGAVIIESDLLIGTRIPVSTYDPEIGALAPVSFDLDWRLQPTAAPYVGVLVAPLPHLKIGLTYRGELSHRLSGPLDIQASIGSAPLPFPMLLRLDTWISPRQAAVGISYAPVRALTAVTDLTWYNYRALRSSPYPFVEISGDAPLLRFPTLDPIAWLNVWALRMGAELKLADERLALRTGYSFRTAMLSLPRGRNSTLLDGSVHGVSLGAGYTLGPRRHRPGERGTNEPTAHPDAPHLSARPGYEEEGWTEDERGTFVARVDVFGRASAMPERRDDIHQIAFRGVFFDAGMSVSLGWY